MDHQLGSLGGDQHDHLEHVDGAVGAEDEPAVWVFADVFDGKRIVDGVKDVLVGYAVLACRPVDLRGEYCITKRGGAGLLRRDADSVVATHAAMSFDALHD